MGKQFVNQVEERTRKKKQLGDLKNRGRI